MAADTLKSASITNLDATPIANITAGEGGPGVMRNVSDFVTATAAGLADTTSTYKTVRLPSNCILKALRVMTTDRLDSNGSPLLALNIGAFYSDSTTDGTQQSLAGTSISANCFAASTVFGSSAAGTNIDALTALAVNKRIQRLWQALGLSSDPGGFIDVVVAVQAGAATGGAGKIYVSADYLI